MPEKTFNFPEGARVKIVIDTVIQETKSNIQEPTITDPEERKKVLAQLVGNMKSNPIPQLGFIYTFDLTYKYTSRSVSDA